MKKIEGAGGTSGGIGGFIAGAGMFFVGMYMLLNKSQCRTASALAVTAFTASITLLGQTSASMLHQE